MKTEASIKDADIISINSGRSGLVDIVGKRNDDDQRFVPFIDLGEIDNNRTTGVNAAYGYLNGESNKYSNEGKHTTKSLVLWSIFVFLAGVVSTFFAITL